MQLPRMLCKATQAILVPAVTRWFGVGVGGGGSESSERSGLRRGHRRA